VPLEGVVGVVGMAAAVDHAPDGAVDGRSCACPEMFGRAEWDLDRFVVLVPLGRLSLTPDYLLSGSGTSSSAVVVQSLGRSSTGLEAPRCWF
jgi:hypothetical protein